MVLGGGELPDAAVPEVKAAPTIHRPRPKRYPRKLGADWRRPMHCCHNSRSRVDAGGRGHGEASVDTSPLKTGEQANERILLLKASLSDGIPSVFPRLAGSVPRHDARKLGMLASLPHPDEANEGLGELVNHHHQQDSQAKLGRSGTTSSTMANDFGLVERRAVRASNLNRYGPELVCGFTRISPTNTPLLQNGLASNARDATHVLDGVLYTT